MNKYKGEIVNISSGKAIPSDEPSFILRAQDVLAPIAVRYYADLLEATTNDAEAAEDIRRFAAEMASWSPRKIPD